MRKQNAMDQAMWNPSVRIFKRKKKL
jgi:hypothetical protein